MRVLLLEVDVVEASVESEKSVVSYCIVLKAKGRRKYAPVQRLFKCSSSCTLAWISSHVVPS